MFPLNDKSEDINIRSALLHMAGDAAGPVGVIVAGFITGALSGAPIVERGHPANRATAARQTGRGARSYGVHGTDDAARRDRRTRAHAPAPFKSAAGRCEIVVAPRSMTVVDGSAMHAGQPDVPAPVRWC